MTATETLSITLPDEKTIQTTTTIQFSTIAQTKTETDTQTVMQSDTVPETVTKFSSETPVVTLSIVVADSVPAVVTVTANESVEEEAFKRRRNIRFEKISPQLFLKCAYTKVLIHVYFSFAFSSLFQSARVPYIFKRSIEIESPFFSVYFAHLNLIHDRGQ